MTTMQCLGCGETRTTRQTVRWPDRRLKCPACGVVTLHRAMADPIQGDWREDLNLDPEGSRTPPGAGLVDLPVWGTEADWAMIPEEARVTFELAGVAPVLIPGLNREGWLESCAKSHGRELVLISAELPPARIIAIADFALAAVTRRKAGLE